MKKIKLGGKYGKNKFAFVDDKDYEKVSCYSWYCCKNGNNFYARTSIWIDNDKFLTKLSKSDIVKEISKKGTRGFIKGKIRKGKRTSVLLHNFVLSSPKNQIIDHKDHNGLNCTRNNMRLCSYSQNQANSFVRSNNTSGFKGVSMDTSAFNKKWVSSIGFKGKRIKVGRFYTKEEAAKAYDLVAKKYYGEFAKLNYGEHI